MDNTIIINIVIKMLKQTKKRESPTVCIKPMHGKSPDNSLTTNNKDIGGYSEPGKIRQK